MYGIFALFLTAFTMQVNCQELVAHVNMQSIKTTVTFRQSGANVVGSFDASSTGLSGSVNIVIRPLWTYYDVDDKCSTTQLGANINGLTATTTYPSDFTLTATTLDDLEERSLILQTSSSTACASIQQEGDYITAAVYLHKTIYGDIFFRKHSVNGNTFIISDLKTFAGFSQANWLIAMNDVDCDNIGDPTQIDVFNPENVNGASCTQDAQSNCAVGALTQKLGSVMIESGSSSNRFSYIDSHLPLDGDKSIAGKYLIVYDTNNVQNVVCSKIHVFEQRTAVSTFNHGGITGSFVFKQSSPFDPTFIMAHLQGLNYEAGGYHVHLFPVPLQSMTNESLCHPEVVAAHLNPYGISLGNTYPQPQVATQDLYETGDLGSKHGTLEGFTEYGPENLTDWNLPLFGKNSIVGRSIVIHRNDSSASRWVCSNIELQGSIISAVAVFTNQVIGHLYFTQTVDNPQTWIFIRLNYIDGSSPTTDHKWQISTDKVGRGMNCTSTGMIYNPTGIWAGDNTYDTKCSNDLRFCKLGDLSGRHGPIGIGKSGTTYDSTAKEFYTDSNVQLSGPDSLIGRSVVIMDSSGSTVISCATIQKLHDLEFSANFNSGNLNGKVTFNQKAGFGQIQTMVSVENLNGFNKDSHGLEIRTHPIASGNNPCTSLGAVYNPLEVTNMSPQTDDQYKVGDLTRRGSREMWYDINLPMKGPTSIMGHSLAIVNQNDVVACANIGFDFDDGNDGYKVAGRLVFSEPVAGKIEISQIFYEDETLSDALITVDLTMSSDTMSPEHNWHVHENPIAGDATAESGRCSSAGPHYDPFMAQIGNASINYSTQCGISSPLRCEVGDQANKLGTYDIGSGAHVYNDVYLPLAGEYSVQGRSIVIHTQSRGAPRLACADIIPIDGIEVSASIKTPNNFLKRTAASVFASAINAEDENVVVEVVSQNDGETKINIHFLGKDRVLLRSKFQNFVSKAENRQSLGDYASITLGKAGHVISSVVVLMISLIIGKLMCSV